MDETTSQTQESESNGLLQWFEDRFNDLLDFLYSLLLTLLDMLKDLFFWIIEQLLDLTLLIISGLDSFFSGLDVAQYINALPPEVQYFASAVGLSQAMGMIIIAITIRFLLQLIPFVRLGS